MPNAYDYTALYWSVTVCGLMTVYSIYAFIYVLLKSSFRWVKFMLFLCVVQNANTVLLAVAVFLEITAWHQAHRDELMFIMGGSIFLFYFVSNLMYWLFGFKYWVISIEIPQLISQQQAELNPDKEIVRKERFCTEAKYNALNAVGILVNFAFCAWVGWKRAELDYESAVPPGASKRLTATVLDLYLVISGLLIVSALFLADSLRRLKQQFS